jgi:tubulin alpha
MGFNIYPGKRTPFSCVEPYNTVLALHSISQYQDISIVLDNLAIEDIGRQIFDLECTPSFTLMNEIISHAITGITGPTRLEGDSDFSLNTLKSSMVDEHFRFLVTAASPLVSN